MHDEYRVRVEVEGETGERLLGQLEKVELSHEARRGLGRVAVTRDRNHLFLYADSREAAQLARETVRAEMQRLSAVGELSLWRWDPGEERWEDLGAPPAVEAEAPALARDRAAELESVRAEEGRFPEWEVRITLPSHAQAREFAARLRDEGIPTLVRFHHLLVGARDEDQARELADRLRAEAPPGSRLEVEGSGIAYYRLMHPFAIFGGIAN